MSDTILGSDLYFRVDTFSVPDRSRGELEAAMEQNLEYLRTLRGFRWHLVIERREGDASVDLITVAAWESRDALEHARHEVMAYYRRIGFDLPSALRRWGVTMSRVDGPGR